MRFLQVGLRVALWVGLAVCGVYVRGRSAAAPAPRGQVPVHWPDDTRLSRTPGRPVMVVFAHPACACTCAALTVLTEVAAELGRAVDVEVVIDDDVPDPAANEIAVRAHQIRGATVVIDRDHTETARFGAITSGHTVLYGAGGDRLFVGGLTDGGGHPGPSAGRTQVLALARGQKAARATPVFGCDLGAFPEHGP
ncbi:MAG TPA: hypothetical protein VLM79_28870 [Kofleriaceae bacterium]|nr:hypothetical protein [Kofleriaceae bacterium]